MLEKQCKTCELKKTIDSFYLGRSVCKICYRSVAKTKSKLRYSKLSKEQKNALNSYYKSQRDNFSNDQVDKYKKRKNIQSAKYKSTKEYKEKHKQYIKNKYVSDINFKLAHVLRTRLNTAIRRSRRAGSAVKDLGCSIEEFKIHLESQFQEGMSWDNYGEWHIDHIKPLANFDLTDEEEFKEACNYNNLQPLWAKDNLSKGAKLCH